VTQSAWAGEVKRKRTREKCEPKKFARQVARAPIPGSIRNCFENVNKGTTKGARSKGR